MQIDPSVSGRGLVTTCGTTADHKFPRCQKLPRRTLAAGTDRFFPACPLVEIYHVAFLPEPPPCCRAHSHEPRRRLHAARGGRADASFRPRHDRPQGQPLRRPPGRHPGRHPAPAAPPKAPTTRSPAPPAATHLCHTPTGLDSPTRQGTRLINQLHNLLARALPELPLLVKDLSAGWVLALLQRYPTAARLAAARPASLEKIPYLPPKHIPALLQHARTSVASLTGPVAEELVRDLVGQLQDAHVRHQALEKLLVSAYRQLPEPNHLDTIIGFGEVTAAILTAKMVSPSRFVEPGKLAGYFGIFPVEASTGLDRHAQPRPPKPLLMSPPPHH